MKTLEKLRCIEQEINQLVLGQSVPNMLVSRGLLTGRNVFFAGPPGGAKSMIGNEWAKRIDGRFFFSQFHSQKKVDELIGPFSIPELMAGEYKRITTGNFVTTADFAMFDEAPRARACKSALLTFLNEGFVEVAGVQIPCPRLMSLMAGNSEMLSEEEQAFNDRICFRTLVEYFKEEAEIDAFIDGYQNRKTLETAVNVTKVSPAEIRVARKEMMGIKISPETKQSIKEIRRRVVDDEKISISNRKLGWFLEAVLAEAWFAGRSVTEPEDCSIGTYVLPNELKHLPTIRKVVNTLVNGQLDILEQKLEDSNSLVNSMNSNMSKQDFRTMSDEIRRIIAELESFRIKPKNEAEYQRILRKVQKNQKAINEKAV